MNENYFIVYVQVTLYFHTSILLNEKVFSLQYINNVSTGYYICYRLFSEFKKMYHEK